MTPFAKTVTFANNATVSSIICVEGFYPVALLIPSGWTTATITVKGSLAPAAYGPSGAPTPDISTFSDMHSAETGDVITFQATAGKLMHISTQPLHANWIALVSSASQTSGPKSVTVLLRGDE